MTKHCILAAVDLGPHSGPVVARAVRLAAERDGIVRLLHVAGAEDPAARTALDALVAALPEADRSRVEDILVRVGDPAEAILAEAEVRQASLIVVGASNRSFLEQVFRGSVTVALVRRSPRPILVARLEPLTDYRLALIAVGIDKPVAPVAAAVRRVLGPMQAELFTVLDESVRLQMMVAEAAPADIQAYSEECVQQAYKTLVAAAGQVAERGWAPRARVAEGVPSREIRHRVETSGSDLLVLQPEAKGAFLRALIGSLTEEILARPQDCDVLVLPVQA